ncbi:IS5 family transposase [Burkholderia multivorans]|uniref:Transposase, IS4 family n=1 Tax=Burkholderia vietnamiensis (strain G4 / LMG 22486) TaxID=269482 RepID=A4JD53_BURVG|nr:IS5 family transposase [Burkholderia multivorans]ABO54206.1 transposase, IS4 family [Burkholderia vietnamiensis G4]MCB4342326.1 IS5 family transposase [Burkholderia vietnamiensis]ABO55051.1 transposase, IS4 family [Burkholderia vietnamiensis G4]ABO56498.1 transposase, IS4 family [Burkholderia vietnamiensis G4]ABO56974.1 transposase, IS4 family [Burkholderia vietnamiensis G4]
MKRQISFAEAECTGKKRVTRRQRFLTEMNSVVPWARLLAALEPYYPKGTRGRPPIGLERMLRIYFLQQWYGLSDEGLEDALYDSIAMRAFAGIDLAVENVPDATTLLKFRRLLLEHDLTRRLFDEIGISLCERGLMMKEGTLVDATIIEAPPSTKNAEKQRDPEMHQTRKGNEWHFGMKAHVGVDADSGLVHSVVGTAANESDVSQAHALLHGHEAHAFGDAGYTGVEKREEMQGATVKWHVAIKRGKIKTMREGALKDLLIAAERTKAQIRARVEHPFHVIKNLFGHRKVRYKGLAKNTAQLFSLFGLANLVLAKKSLLASHGSSPS